MGNIKIWTPSQWKGKENHWHLLSFVFCQLISFQLNGFLGGFLYYTCRIRTECQLCARQHWKWPRRDLPLISPKCIHAGRRDAGWGLNREKTKMTGISPPNPFSGPLTHEWGQKREKGEKREWGREREGGWGVGVGGRVDNQFVSNATKNWQV